MADITGNSPGKPRKPTALKVLHGDFKKDPQRQNKNEPPPTGEPIAPEGMSAPAKENWNYLLPHMMRARMMSATDVHMLAEFCEAVVVVKIARVAVMRAATGQVETLPGAASPYTNYAKAVNVMTNLGGRLGLSPADRSRLVMVGTETERDELISGL